MLAVVVDSSYEVGRQRGDRGSDHSRQLWHVHSCRCVRCAFCWGPLLFVNVWCSWLSCWWWCWGIGQQGTGAHLSAHFDLEGRMCSVVLSTAWGSGGGLGD